MIRAVLFDLDDTLYEQAAWLRGAWLAVATRAAAWGIDPSAMERALTHVAGAGSDRGGIIDNALTLVGATRVPVAPLVACFRSYTPTSLDPYPGVADALARLATRCPLGLVSDGEPAGQRAKLAALGLERHFSVVVWSDELGRAHRKPDPLPFRLALGRLDVAAGDAVYIGDRPSKDVAGPAAIGMRAIRVRTGEWRDDPDDKRCWTSVDTVLDAVEHCERADEPRIEVGAVAAASPRLTA